MFRGQRQVAQGRTGKSAATITGTNGFSLVGGKNTTAGLILAVIFLGLRSARLRGRHARDTVI